MVRWDQTVDGLLCNPGILSTLCNSTLRYARRVPACLQLGECIGRKNSKSMKRRLQTAKNCPAQLPHGDTS